MKEADDDARLMAEFVRTRDRKMFETLFQRYRRPIVAHCGRYVRTAAQAEELAQDVFIRVYTTKAYQPDAKFRTWIYRVATNVCLNELRKPERERRAVDLEKAEDPGRIARSDLVALPATPEEAVHGRQVAERVERVLAALPANQRAAFLMVRQDGMAHDEVAQVLETSVSAVKSLVHRALETLRKEVGGIPPAVRAARGNA